MAAWSGPLAVSPSDPRIVYMGTGDVSNVGGAVNYGNGMYKSEDEGKTWKHIGLEGTEKIGGLWIDPGSPDVVIVAALGQTYARSEHRGLFKTSDGGKSWRKVLYKDDIIGAVDVTFDPTNPQTRLCDAVDPLHSAGRHSPPDRREWRGLYLEDNRWRRNLEACWRIRFAD
jgi:hypothetical protein